MAITERMSELFTNTGIRPAGVYHFTLGDFHCFAMSDESGAPVPVTMYGFGQPQTEVMRLLSAHALDPHISPMQVTPLLVDTGQHLVLFDSGFGNMTGPGQAPGKLHHHLRAMGIHASDVDLVVLSHLHPDHIGGLFTEDEQLAFPNARYLVGRIEWGFWSNSPTLESIPMPEMFRQEQIKRANYTLPRIAEHIELLDDSQEFLPGFTVISTPGHTPGHLSFLVSSGGQTLLLIGDAWTHPVITMEKPEWDFILDVDHAASLQSKLKLLQLAEEQRYLVSTYHFSWPGLGHVVKRDEHWAWEPVEFHWGS